MKLAVIAGGWHFPLHFYRSMAAEAPGADLFCIGHRSPDLAIVSEEKRPTLETLPGRLGDLDRELYAAYATTESLKQLGWTYLEEPNTCGDWGFLNQWLGAHDWTKYDCIAFLHDDTYLRRDSTFPRLDGDEVLVWAHSRHVRNAPYQKPDMPAAPEGYLRGSLEFFSRELIELVGGEIPLGDLTLTREGQTDTPRGMAALAAWNSTCEPLRQKMRQWKATGRISYLSDYYRVSMWAIEGERGLLSNQDGARWSYEAGLKAYPI